MKNLNPNPIPTKEKEGKWEEKIMLLLNGHACIVPEHDGAGMVDFIRTLLKTERSQTLKRVEKMVEGMKKPLARIDERFYEEVGRYPTSAEREVSYNQALSDLLKRLRRKYGFKKRI